MTVAREFRVNVYTHEPREAGQRRLVLAYTTYDGPNACVHHVVAGSGTEAKRVAIQTHRAVCLAPARPATGPPS